jgi:hypothetical protein
VILGWKPELTIFVENLTQIKRSGKLFFKKITLVLSSEAEKTLYPRILNLLVKSLCKKFSAPMITIFPE